MVKNCNFGERTLAARIAPIVSALVREPIPLAGLERLLECIARGLFFWPMRTDVVVFNTLAIRGHSKWDH
jgi:hypothetical protein